MHFRLPLFVIPRRFSIGTLTVLVTVCAYLVAWGATHKHGEAAVNDFEAAKYGKWYMAMRTDLPRAYLPFIVVTGLTTTTHNVDTGEITREPAVRRFYLWLGPVIKLWEWHRRPSSC